MLNTLEEIEIGEEVRVYKGTSVKSKQIADYVICEETGTCKRISNKVHQYTLPPSFEELSEELQKTNLKAIKQALRKKNVATEYINDLTIRIESLLIESTVEGIKVYEEDELVKEINSIAEFTEFLSSWRDGRRVHKKVTKASLNRGSFKDPSIVKQKDMLEKHKNLFK